MQLLYVVEADVHSADSTHSTLDLFEKVIAHVLKWQTRLTREKLRESGSLQGWQPRNRALYKNLEWETVESPKAFGLKLTVSEQTTPTIGLTTRLTITCVEGNIRFRVGIAREYLTSQLSPADETTIWQPAIISLIAEDETLHLATSSGNLISGLYRPIRDQKDVFELSSELQGNEKSSENRLPIVLIHLRSPSGWETAKKLSRKLIGLVDVKTLNSRTAIELGRILPSARVPFGGLLLIWPNLLNHPVRIESTEVEFEGADAIRARLMALLAPSSVLARGADKKWNEVVNAWAAEKLRAIELQVEEANRAGDTSAEAIALREQVEYLTEDRNEWRELARAYEGEASEARSLRNRVEELTIYRDLYFKSFQDNQEFEEVDPWSAIPSLATGEDPSSTFLALSDASSDSIFFTENATRTWVKAKKLDPQMVTSALIKFARGAMRMYEEYGQTNVNVVWWKENFELTVVDSDTEIERNPRARSFSNDGQIFSQVKHVKINDAGPFETIARIYFDYDKASRRVIVNHVGTKLTNRSGK